MPEVKLDFLTEEPVTGELLAERLQRGPLSPTEALNHSIEIGIALGKAHAAGRVHGALSPASISISGGIARLLQPDPSPVARAAYCSPEEILGEVPDARGDIWAFGAVAYEMATGRRAFPGAGAELNRNILHVAPAGFTLRSPVFPALEGVIFSCLQQSPASRRQRIQNAVIELKLLGRTVPRIEEASRQQVRRAQAAPQPLPRPYSARTGLRIIAPNIAPYRQLFNRRFWMIGIALLALTATSLAAVLILQQRPPARALKFALPQTENTRFPGIPAVSPDGKYFTFSAIGPEGSRALWLRALDALHATRVGGTEGAAPSAPFWSPDSQFIAFFAGKNLKRVRISGGIPEVICPAEESPGGGAWNKDGTILFSPGLADTFYTVPAGGGNPQPVFKLDHANSERAALWPQFLPDGKHFVFYMQTDLAENSGVYSGSLDDPAHRRLFTSQTNAVYSAVSGSAKGYLLFINGRNLSAQAFNAGSMEVAGPPIMLPNEVEPVASLSLAPISVSAGGTLVYQGVGKPTRQLVWVDRGGKQLAAIGQPGEYGPPRISPDGERAIVAKLSADGVNAHLWMLDASGAYPFGESKLHEGSPIWSPGGSKITYFAKAKDDEFADIYERPAAPGGKAEILYRSPGKKVPTGWSPDGKYLIFQEDATTTGLDLWVFSRPEHRAAPLIASMYSEGFAVVSPNGKWLAYQSTQVGKHYEVFVQSFDGLSPGAQRRQISPTGGGLPQWTGNGSELCYITNDGRMMSVPIHDQNRELQVGEPQRLFQTRPVPGTWNRFDVSPDGQRFLMNLPLEWTSAAPVTVITNWTGQLRD